MRKTGLTAAVWTLALALPLTVLAISSVAYITDHLSDITNWVTNLSRASTAGGRGWILEFSERWPELAGMVIGQLVIFIILIFARKSVKANGTGE